MVALVVGMLALAGVLGGSDGSGPPVAARAALTAPAGPGGRPDGPSGTADLTATRQGSAVAVRVWGIPAGQRCALVLVTRNGVRQQVATWVASYAGGAQVSTVTELAPSEVGSVLVEALDGGRTLLRGDTRAG